ncbi:hypothetical protein DFH28DRAFT_457054 [Melampsora americana]|nr:hypothetical protein DFH28DRAFT_457054 [Melampsora americana]
MANIHTLAILILSVCLKLISSNLNDLTIKSPIESHIFHVEDNFNTLTSHPDIPSNAFISEVPEADHHLRFFEEEINEILGRPSYMDHYIEETDYKTFHHIQPNSYLLEKPHKPLKILAGESQHDQDAVPILNTLVNDIESHQVGRTLDATQTANHKDSENELIEESDHLHHNKIQKPQMDYLKKSSQKLKSSNFKKKKLQNRFEDVEGQQLMLNLDGHISSTRGMQLHGSLKRKYILEEKTLAHEIQWQAHLAIWYSPGLSTTIKLAFKDFEDHVKVNLSKDWEKTFTTEKILGAIKRTRSDVVIGFFGVLKAIFNGQKEIPEMRLLVEDGWNFIYKYFDDEFKIFQNKIKSTPSLIQQVCYESVQPPGAIISHVLVLSERSIVSFRIIFGLLKRWYQSCKYKTEISFIPMDYFSAIQDFEALYKQRGGDASIWRSCGDRRRSDKKNESKRIKLDGEMDKKAQDYNFRNGIRREGNKLIESNTLEEKIKNYFTRLRRDIREIYAPPEGDQDSGDDLPSSAFENLKTLHQATFRAERFITPTFMGILNSMLSEIQMDASWSLMIQRGWEHLQTYFNRWLIFLSKNKYSVLSPKSLHRSTSIDWSDEQMTISYLASVEDITNISPQLVWFLLDLWYEGIMTSKQGEIHDISTRILPPNRKQLRIDFLGL